jgi:large subunit ribosomal protein L22
MAYKYSTKIGENCSKAIGVALPISRKQSLMICQYIRGKNVQKAKQFLADVIAFKKPVPFTKFTNGLGHKPGMCAGRYPVKACQRILEILETAEANAQFKGLSNADLIIKHISAQQGPKTWHYGRQTRVKAKRTHIEVVLEEKKVKKEVKA